jgi:hypothetical protein
VNPANIASTEFSEVRDAAGAKITHLGHAPASLPA